jgi:hypothetical protein
MIFDAYSQFEELFSPSFPARIPNFACPIDILFPRRCVTFL